jgi:hypothetical protein
MRPHVTILAAAFCFLALPAAAQDDQSIEQLKADVLKLDMAYADEDAATIESMLLPGQISITARYGGAATVDRQVAAFEDTERTHYDHSPIEVKLLSPDIALVTFEKSYKGTYKGDPLPPRVAVGEVWMKQDGKWMNQSYQETAIAPQ